MLYVVDSGQNVVIGTNPELAQLVWKAETPGKDEAWRFGPEQLDEISSVMDTAESDKRKATAVQFGFDMSVAAAKALVKYLS